MLEVQEGTGGSVSVKGREKIKNKGGNRAEEKVKEGDREGIGGQKGKG